MFEKSTSDPPMIAELDGGRALGLKGGRAAVPGSRGGPSDHQASAGGGRVVGGASSGTSQSIWKQANGTDTEGARHLKVLSGGRGLAFLRGKIQHKDLWLMDPETGVERQLTNLPDNFDILDFDISRDGREIILERVQERSDIMLLDLARQ
jgi:hypothetical protein